MASEEEEEVESKTPEQVFQELKARCVGSAYTVVKKGRFQKPPYFQVLSPMKDGGMKEVSNSFDDYALVREMQRSIVILHEITVKAVPYQIIETVDSSGKSVKDDDEY